MARDGGSRKGSTGLAAHRLGFAAAQRSRPLASRNLSTVRTRRLRVTLCNVEPAVVRVLDVPASALLPEVHDLLQAALGWTDSHLHQFVTETARYGVPDLDGFEDDGEGELDARGVPLRELLPRFRYLYDFGDGWEHEVELLGSGGERPGCVSGEGACPPEDVGGPSGFARLREALANPDDPEHEELRTWAGDWHDHFDSEATDLLVRQTAGAVPATVRLVLDLAGDGVELTPGGRLPRAFVRQVQQHEPGWDPLGRPVSLEDDLPPLAALHELLRAVGLLRLRNGTLAPTRAAGDEVEVVRRLRSWFGPDDGFTSILAGESVATLASAGPCRPEELATRVFPQLGDHWVTPAGEPLTEHLLLGKLYDLEPVLVGLDLVALAGDTWSAGPSGRWLLPRATALARLWSTPGEP